MTSNDLPKMQEISNLAQKELERLIPFLSIQASDNLCSSVTIKGAFQKKEEWAYGIFHNAPYFIIFLRPTNGKRWYDPSDVKIEMELSSKGGKVLPLRKYSSSPEKVIQKLKAWILSQKS